jgi:predicted HTH transcriptional regulator
MWQPIALREAIINAFVHNDYTKEIAPTIEIFSDRIEITSAGSLPEDLSRKEFFNGYSIPRNKELMRVFKDLELVEHLGSGIPRILQYYEKECFLFTENFTRIIFPIDPEYSKQVTPQVTPQDAEHVIEGSFQVIELIKIMDGEITRTELMERLGLSDRKYFRKEYLQKALNANLIELTIPDKPASSKQKYRLTRKGKKLQEQLKKKK